MGGDISAAITAGACYCFSLGASCGIVLREVHARLHLDAAPSTAFLGIFSARRARLSRSGERRGWASLGPGHAATADDAPPHAYAPVQVRRLLQRARHRP